MKYDSGGLSLKNYVIILAGGAGSRMKSDTPKQFIEVNNKPIIVYSIENFQRSNQIEKILIVCLKEWIDFLQKIVNEYGLTKVEWIIEGGTTGHDSIRNGIFFLRDKIEPDDYVIVHDAVRPILPQAAINELINVAHKNGNASSSIACHPPIVLTDDFISATTDIDRNHVMLTASPQMYKFSLALKCYERAEAENKHNFTFTSSLLIYCGERVFFAKGTTNNIKITQREDLALLSALLTIPEEMLFSN